MVMYGERIWMVMGDVWGMQTVMLNGVSSV